MQRSHRLSKTIGYVFKDMGLLRSALMHPSYINENPDCVVSEHFERLEFLGDAVLELAITDIILNLWKGEDEGGLSRIRASVINEDSLSQIALILGIDRFIYLGKGEEIQGGRKSSKILSDTLEAIIGAIYLDSDYYTAKDVIRKIFDPLIKDPSNKGKLKDYKSQLQEYTQRHFKEIPSYILISEDGPEHKKLFTIGVKVEGKIIGVGKGKNKKQAQKEAAKEALIWLKKRGNL